MISVNPLPSLRAGLQIRPAVSSDRRQIADLIQAEPRVHRHLDWRTPLEWLGSAPYWVLQDGRQIVAALACPPDPDSIAWIRLFVHASRLSSTSAWQPLWEAVQRELTGRGGMMAAAITMQNWFDSILLDSGFQLFQQIVLLERNNGLSRSGSLPAGITLRQMTAGDLPQVVEVDAAAFEPLWRNSLDALIAAFSQSVYASVAEAPSGLVGYQLSTGNPLGAHLARLAVRPEMQGQGIATGLVDDLIRHVHPLAGAGRITVNTQADNSASLALYQKMGFLRTGEQYPVYTFRVEQAYGT